MKRAMVLGVAGIAYVGFLIVFGVLADFVAGTGYVRGVDGAPVAGMGVAIPIDLALIGAFGVSHSVMARGAFKAWWTRVVPVGIERSVYVLVTDVMLGLMVWQWRAMPERVWQVEGALRSVVWAVSGIGVVIVVVSTFLTDHFDLFGLRQAWSYGREYRPVPFREWGLYRYVRHPMMVGIVMWIWAAPSMSVGHLVFAGAMTAYIGVGVAFEERGLARALGAPYADYRARVRAFVPVRRRT